MELVTDKLTKEHVVGLRWLAFATLIVLLPSLLSLVYLVDSDHRERLVPGAVIGWLLLLIGLVLTVRVRTRFWGLALVMGIVGAALVFVLAGIADTRGMEW